MNKIYIIDSINFLFRSYYAIGPMMNAEGQSTSALYGFIRSVQKLIKDFSPEYLVCVFDGPDNKKSRQAIYADYKTHRTKAPEDLYPQFELASQWCRYAGIPTLCLEGVEADDTMAAVALWAKKHHYTSYLCTSDKDLTQLVDDQTFLIHAHKNNLLIDKAKVEELFGVRPDQILDYLAIVGDASDNIPGLPGFGPKTAAALLREFGTLDKILAHPELVKGAKKQEILREEKKTALMSRELATLNTNIEIPQKTESYRIQSPDRTKLAEFYHKMHFNSLIREIDSDPQQNIEQPDGQIQYRLVDDRNSLQALLKHLDTAKEVCLDTETTDISPMNAELVGIGFCIKPMEAWYIPCNGKLGKDTVVDSLKHFFSNAKCSFYGHNIKYDLHVLENANIPLKNISFDTLIASYLLNPQTRRHGLDELMLEICKKVKTPIESLIGKGKQQIGMQDVPVDQVCNYCCEDADDTARLKNIFEEELKQQNLSHLFFEIELPLLPILAKMERTGIFLDAEKLKGFAVELNQEIDRIKTTIFDLVGEEFNLNSPKQLSHILFEKLGMKAPSRKTSAFSTGADVLEDLAIHHPVAQKILDYRGLEKLRSTYVEALPLSIHPKTKRIHCTFSQSVAATGRLSCQDPNLQNIPIRSKEGLLIRSCFQPEKPNWSYLGSDYSQIELRILAHFSGDPGLTHAFRSNQDIHTYTASLVYDIPQEMVTSEMRSLAKTVNFGIIYGQSAFGLSKQLRISTKEASEFIKTYFKRYPKVLDYLEFCKDEARKTGFATTLTGRKRPIPELTNQNPSIRAAAERLAINTPLQGTAADLIKMAMIAIDEEIQQKRLEGKMILQIHDELIFEIPDHEIPTFRHLVKEKMEHVLNLNVPIEVHIAVGKNWAEC